MKMPMPVVSPNALSALNGAVSALSPNSSCAPVSQFKHVLRGDQGGGGNDQPGGHILAARAQGGQPSRRHQAEQNRGVQQRADARRHQVLGGGGRAFHPNHRDGIAQQHPVGQIQHPTDDQRFLLAVIAITTRRAGPGLLGLAIRSPTPALG